MQTQNLQEQVQELVYEKLKNNLPAEWTIDKSDNSIMVLYESPYYEDNADLVIWLDQNSAKIEYMIPTGEDPIDPTCASVNAYEACMQEKGDEKICQEEAEKAYEEEEKKKFTKYGGMLIVRLHNDGVTEHLMFIPAEKVVVNLTLPADASADKIADLITDIALALIHNV